MKAIVMATESLMCVSFTIKTATKTVSLTSANVPKIWIRMAACGFRTFSACCPSGGRVLGPVLKISIMMAWWAMPTWFASFPILVSANKGSRGDSFCLSG